RAAGTAQRLVDDVADRAAVRIELLLGETDGADAPDITRVGRDAAGQHVQQARLAAAVLADDRESRPRRDGHRDVIENPPPAAREAHAGRGELGGVARGNGKVDNGGSVRIRMVNGQGSFSVARREPGSASKASRGTARQWTGTAEREGRGAA